MAIPGRLKIWQDNEWKYVGFGPQGTSGWSGWSGAPGTGGVGGGIGPVKYIILNDSGTYKCYDGVSGSVVSSNATATTVINWALSNLTSGRTWKETVLLRGNFTINARIVMQSYAILALEGKVFRANGTDNHMIYGSAQSNFEIVGGNWDGNRAGQTVYSDADTFKFYSCTDMYFHNFSIHSSPYQNLSFEDCSRIIVENVESYDTAWDEFMFWSCSEVRCSHNYVHDSDQGGIYSYTEDDAIAQTVNNIVYEENRVERTISTGLSISLRGTEDTGMYGRIEHNTLIDCGHDGQHPAINVGFGGTKLARYCMVHGNTIYETGTYDAGGGCGGGINLEGEHCVVSDNVIYHLTDGAIYVLTGQRNLIVNNLVRDTRGASSSGIYLIDSDYNEVRGNVIRDSAVNGIYLETDGGDGSDYNHITGNTIEGVDSWWVRIASTCDNNIIEYNDFIGAKTVSSSGTGNIFRRNNGLVTEKSGSATFTAATSLTISHGLANTPTKVIVTGSDSNSGALWITGLSTTQFTVNRANSTGTPTIYWIAEV